MKFNCKYNIKKGSSPYGRGGGEGDKNMGFAPAFRKGWTGIISIALFIFSFSQSQNIHSQTLGNYLQIASENNPELKSVYAEFEAALQRAPQMRSLPDPVLTVGAFGRMMETNMGQEKAKFSLMQMFPWFGTLEARENTSTLIAEAKFQEFLDAKNELFFQISRQYYVLYELEEKIKFNTKDFQILKNYKDLALSQVRAGSGSLTDVLKVEIKMNENENMLKGLELQQKATLAKFNLLLDREETETVNISEEINMEFLEVKNWSDFNIAAHPKLLRMEKMIAVAESQKTEARKNGLPTIGIGIEYMIVAENKDFDMKNNGTDAFMPMASISLPIFRKKHKAAQAEAEFMQESYTQKKIAVQNKLKAEFEDAIFRIENLKNQIQLYTKQIESTQRILDLTLSYYQNAKAEFEEVLELRQELLAYELKITQAKSTYLIANAEMNYITGKSFENEN
ncbi:MAG TPA: TolC family protein [Salinimicrobium sp.]|nr:TolC family protein [Salinimicrobium sp.]